MDTQRASDAVFDALHLAVGEQNLYGCSAGGSSIKNFFVIFVCLFALRPACAHAETLKQALAEVYSDNPQLLSERAKLRSVDEQVSEALSDWRPTISAQGDAGRSHEVYDNTSGNLWPSDASVTLSQPLFRGGKTVAATRQAEAAVASERAQLDATEQTVLVNAATAYLDLLQDQAVLDLQAQNVQTLKDWVGEANERYRLGEKTVTDVNLFQSRLARAEADQRTADINLSVARASYLRYIGHPADTLADPDIVMNAPADHDATLDLARKAAPEVMAAYYASQSQDENIRVVRGNLLPELSLQGTSAYGWNENVPEQFIDQNRTVNDQVVVQLKVPLYTGGGDYARLREAYQQSGEKRFDLDEARREALAKAEQAWQQFAAMEQVIDVRKSEVDAAQATVKGMKEEERIGDRSSFDTLDAEQDLLNAQTDLVEATHDRTVALIQLNAATGHFLAADLHLDVQPYNPDTYYKDNRGRWLGVGDAPKELIVK